MEYQPEEVDRFIEVADAVEDAFPGLVVEGVEVRAMGGMGGGGLRGGGGEKGTGG